MPFNMQSVWPTTVFFEFHRWLKHPMFNFVRFICLLD